MITAKKVSIYEQYNGFIDAYIFENGSPPNADFELDDWSLIDELIGNIILLERGNLSLEFRRRLEDYIAECTTDEVVVAELIRLAQKKKQTGY